MTTGAEPPSYLILAAEKERFRELSDAAFEGIGIHDKGVIVDVNQALAQMLGYTRQELIGLNALELVTAPESRQHAGDMIRSASSAPDEVFMVRKDGSKFLAQVRGRPMQYQGRQLRVVAVNDISEQKRLEAQVRLTQQVMSMNSLAAGVAHEVNNPLTYVIGNLELLGSALGELRGRIPGEQLSSLQQAVSEALDGSQRVRAIVADLRRLSRPAGEGRAPVRLAAVLETAIRISGNEIRHRAQLVREYGTTPLVEASELRLVQVFVNLLLNAAQSIGEGRASQHRIVVRLATAESGQAVVEVSDTGVGMSPEVASRLFEPFFSTKPGGTGLGLSISRSIVESTGGEITATSHAGQGSTFRVTLPPLAPSAVAAPASPPQAATPTGLQVLIIDDEPTVGKTLARMIQPDHRALAITSIVEALRLIEGGARFDVILCDLMMPEGTGMELRERLEQVAPELVPRMLFMTGGLFTPAAEDFVARKDIRYVEKPLLRDRLLLALAATAVR